ncbi:MAG: hypothetical protein QGF46_02700 [Planctomycetota bacterium]|jgi:hypothetical protein|nr:hypothetical protein [Planctomycetota bacterium]
MSITKCCHTFSPEKFVGVCSGGMMSKAVNQLEQTTAEVPDSEMRETFPHSEKIYAYYTTCPACANEFGKNYVVLMAQVIDA